MLKDGPKEFIIVTIGSIAGIAILIITIVVFHVGGEVPFSLTKP